MLVEFPSVVDAVRCAVEVQRGMVDRNAEISEDKRISFRIGVNLGDIIVEADDIFGDGVNVAARLEALAEPSGICISRVVRDQIRDKLPYPFEDMGEQTVKNIARPVRVFAIGAAAVASTPLVPARTPSARARTRASPSALIAALLVAAAGIGLGAWWVWPHRSWSPSVLQAPASSQNLPTVKAAETKSPPRLSIVVLPFENLSNDPEQEFLADGITDDLTTDLSHIPDSFVIARTTAFAYKGKAVDVKQIGKELGVRYALEGSVRRVGRQVETNVQLIDTENGAHVWADRFEADRADLPQAQDEIAGRLARTLQLEIFEAAARRIEQENPATPDPRDYVIRGWAWYYRPVTTATLLEAQQAFERALEIDPQSIDAKIGLATVLTEFVANGRNHVVNGVSLSPEQDLKRSEQLLTEVFERGTNNSRAHFAQGRLRRLQNRLVESRIALEKALSVDPHYTGAMLQLGITLIYLGQPKAALAQLERALRLTPSTVAPAFYFYYWLGFAHLLLNDTEDSIDFFQKARAANPRFPPLFLAAALGLKGDVNEAKAVLAESLKLRPEWNSLAALRANVLNWDASPQFVTLREKTVDVGLRRAGLPDK
jgi:adenylate cyclase